MADVVDMGGAVKKVPKWGWLAIGGGALIGVWLIVRSNGQSAAPTTGGSGLPGLGDAMGMLGLQGAIDKVQTAVGGVTDKVADQFDGLQTFLEERFGSVDDALTNLGQAETERNRNLLDLLNEQFSGADAQFNDLQTLVKTQFGDAGKSWQASFENVGVQLRGLQSGINSAGDASNAAQTKLIVDALTTQLAAITRQLTAMQTALSQQPQGASYSAVLAAASRFRDEFGGWGQEARYNWTLDEIVQKLRVNQALWAGRPERELLLSLPITHDYPMGPR
jgi:hypothetical protein